MAKDEDPAEPSRFPWVMRVIIGARHSEGEGRESSTCNHDIIFLSLRVEARSIGLRVLSSGYRRFLWCIIGGYPWLLALIGIVKVIRATLEGFQDYVG
jgi:hypothetical protein